MLEIIIYGRGGEGAKTAAFLLARAAIKQGMFAQAFPEYGPERSGAPVKAFVRIDDKPIRTHSPIFKADALIIINPTLVYHKDIYESVKKDALILLNTPSSEKINENTFIVDATRITKEVLGKPITNIAMLGAFIKLKEIVSLEVLKEFIKQELSSKGMDIVNKNIEALERAYREVKHV